MTGMLDLADVHSPLATLLEQQLERIAIVFERQLASDLSAVNALCLHVEQYRGKMLRPALVLLSGLAGADDSTEESTLTEKHRIIAAVVEMIHMATLVHDDVLDEADIRRRGATVNRMWDNETAVMLGDYLISNAFHLCSTAFDPSINLALGQVTNTLCEGELIQLHHREDCGLDEATYLEIVRRKTASLIAECCRLGAMISGADPHVSKALHRFGESLGIAFQIQDDLLDLIGEERIVGKSLGRDLEKGKITLPIIFYLQNATQAERGLGLKLIAQTDADALHTRLLDSGAVEQAGRVALDLVDQAKDELSVLQSGPARDLLMSMADAVITRNR
ncbi:MAG: polyprenyl synthetase family protein [Planctomycetota bacterium]|nr:polyprenyl synthetase family protein [Planctomycetota bacterium]